MKVLKILESNLLEVKVFLEAAEKKIQIHKIALVTAEKLINFCFLYISSMKDQEKSIFSSFSSNEQRWKFSEKLAEIGHQLQKQKARMFFVKGDLDKCLQLYKELESDCLSNTNKEQILKILVHICTFVLLLFARY